MHAGFSSFPRLQRFGAALGCFVLFWVFGALGALTGQTFWYWGSIVVMFAGPAILIHAIFVKHVTREAAAARAAADADAASKASAAHAAAEREHQAQREAFERKVEAYAAQRDAEERTRRENATLEAEYQRRRAAAQQVPGGPRP